MRQRTIWSIVEVEWLKQNKHQQINQICIVLSKSRNAVKNKIRELEGKPSANIKLKKKRSNIGKRKDLGIFLRSSWEANCLRLLKIQPEVAEVLYEPIDFTFTAFGIYKGTVSYTPDFKVIYKNGTYNFIEVKGGFLRTTDKTKLRRFKKFYPEEFNKLLAVVPGKDSKTAKFFTEIGVEIKWYYPEINKTYKNTIPNWE